MHDAPDAESENSPYLRLPWALVAAALAGVLLVALGVGLYANRYLRPQLGVQATPVTVAAGTVPSGPVARTVSAAGPTKEATPGPTAAPGAAPVFTADPTPSQPAVATQSPPTATPVPAPATPNATPLVSGMCG